MGLRLVAHYYDRSEAYVARSVVEAAGFLAFLHNESWIRSFPNYLGALGGYRLMVSEADLDEAVALLIDAKANPLLEGEQLELTGGLWDRVMSFVAGYALQGVPTPIRASRWIPFEQSDGS